MGIEAGAKNRLAKILAAGFFILLVNSSYLAGRSDPTVFYFSNLAFHILAAPLLLVLYAAFLVKCWKRMPRMLLAGSAVLLAGAVFGFYLVAFGAYHSHWWAIDLHVGLSAAGSALVVVQFLLSRRSEFARRQKIAYLAAAVLVFVFPVASAGFNRYEAHARQRIVNPANAPLSMDQEGGGPGSPFFPSSAETNVGGTIPSTFFMTSQDCGRCHKQIYEQWRSSAHHFSSFNNQWYRKSVEYMQDVIGTRPSKWCAGCHDHAVFFNGRFDRPIKEQIDTPEAQAGLACTSCHSIVHVGSTMGQGNFEIEYPPLHDLATSKNPILKFAHDFLLRCDPEPHRETFIKGFHTGQTAEFCSACHKVHLDVPVNGYRWFRGFNEYDNWQASGVSGQGARSFYYPPKPQECADCHMPLVPSDDPAAENGMIHSHRFPAANTALPYVNKDAEQLKAEQNFLRAGQVSIDIFGLVRGGPPNDLVEKKRTSNETPNLASTFAVGEESASFGSGQAYLSKPAEVVAPLGKVGAAVRRGDSVRVEVVVRTRKVGHFFPGGTVDAFDVWVELEAVDSNGRTIFHSGLVEDGGKGPVEKGAHFYRSLQIDEHGNVINKRNAWAARSVAYVRLIPPGAADTVHFRLNIPKDCGDKIFLRARVNYRKFSWWNTQWAFAGVRDPAGKNFALSRSYDDGKWVFTGDTSHVSGKIKAIPDIPITVMAYNETSLNVLPENAVLPQDKPYLDRSVRERWNDYGIGLLLQGDIKGAEAAFEKVTQMDPGYADGWVNVARAGIQEGNVQFAQTELEKALQIDPKLAKTHFFMAMALKSMGRYDDALAHLQVAVGLYPNDRVVVNQIGRLLFLKREYQLAIEQFQRVLRIDPEDLQAHYNLMLCYQGLGQRDLAATEETLYKRFKADESSQFLTGDFRQLHPEDNNERQAIHEHYSVPLDANGKVHEPGPVARGPAGYSR